MFPRRNNSDVRSRPEAIRAFLNERITGVEISGVDVFIPYVLRTPSADVAATLTGNRFGPVLRRGKFLLFGLADAVAIGQCVDPDPRFQCALGQLVFFFAS